MTDFQMLDLIDRIYSSGNVMGPAGDTLPLESCIDPQEGSFLYNLIIQDAGIARTLEVGCAYGLSSLHICMGTKGRTNARHTIVDPFQSTQWKGVGVRHLVEVGIDTWELIERRSEYVLPELAESREGEYDFIFIDGWHTFDHAMLDCFYANKLLRVGGVLAIDDVNFPAVRMVVDHLLTYPCYESIGSVDRPKLLSGKQKLLRHVASMLPLAKRKQFLSSQVCRMCLADEKESLLVAMRMTKQDERNWDWHADFL